MDQRGVPFTTCLFLLPPLVDFVSSEETEVHDIHIMAQYQHPKFAQ